MSLFDNPEYRWRETYLLFHKKTRRASAKKLQQVIGAIRGTYQLENLSADAAEDFESATVFAPEAFAAIDLSYAEDDQIRDQIDEIQMELKEVLEDAEDLAKLDSLVDFDARIDLLHFERLQGDFIEQDDEMNTFFDPEALLAVIEKLSEMTGGVCLDPASATIM